MTSHPHPPLAAWAGLATLATALGLSACAGLPAARIELPDTLAAVAPVTMEAPIGLPRGDFRWGALEGRFERQASRLELFERLAQDRALVSFTLAEDGLRADCKLIANTATLGVLQLPLKRASYACGFSRDGQPLARRLALTAVDAAAGTREERRGQFIADAVVLDLQSLHRLQGAALPVAAPVGYVLRHQGVAVAAVDLNDTLPRLWLQAPTEPVREAALQAALALALLWDPAAR